MAKYPDPKSYLQANYLDAFKGAFRSSSINPMFHRIKVPSLCRRKIENSVVKALTCHDDIGPRVKMDVGVEADIIQLGIGTKRYEADRKDCERLYANNPDFAGLIDSGRFIYIGYVTCINDSIATIKIRDTRRGAAPRRDAASAGRAGRQGPRTLAGPTTDAGAEHWPAPAGPMSATMKIAISTSPLNSLWVARS